MNNVSLVGRLTRDPEVRYSKSNTSLAVTRFSIAVDRRFKKEGQADVDFINCVAFGKTGEFVEKYFSKGQRIGLVGRMQTGSYTNNEGQKIYTTDVIAENVEFVESKKADYQGPPKGADVGDGFVNIPDELEEELPFI